MTNIQTVLPGDDVTSQIKQLGKDPSNVKLGRGLSFSTKKENDGETSSSEVHVSATRAGMLTSRGNTYFIQSNSKRYIPTSGDRVLGIVEERMGEYYKVNVFGPHTALMHTLAFEGATKRNKPNLQPGSLVYCRLISKDLNVLDPELTCKVESGISSLGRKDWMTDEGMYGELKCSDVTGSTCIRVSIGLARELLNPNNLVLRELGSTIPFEIAIGVNGFVWVNSHAPIHTILICNAIQNSEVLSPEQTRGMVKTLLKTITK